jgi:undecaprenyl diphosphate synthase
MHLGIIMDGNGRWATAQGLPRLSGHAAGVQTLKTIIRACPSLQIRSVSLFAFAIANWKRDKEEVDGLWKLFELFVLNDMEELITEGVRVITLGNKAGLPESIRASLNTVETRSALNTTLVLQIALNYDGVDEVARLIQRTLQENTDPKLITSDYVREHLDTLVGFEPDSVIRTGMSAGSNGMSMWRSSAFLPIQSAQSVCVSTEVLWPDMTVAHLQEIIAFADPQSRLFGGQRNESATSTTAV